MKTESLLMMGALFALIACADNNTIIPEPETMTPTENKTSITFNLTATHPDDAAQTRAVKTGWERGDAIFVFFDNIAAPKHLKMTYDGSAWTYTEYNGATASAGCLGLTNGMTGTMRAVYLPFGSAATVSADGTSFKFSSTQYSYYATATLDYTVKNNKLSGAFDMTIPEGFVQFFVPGDISGYTLGCDAVIPTGIVSIAADGTVVETSDMPFSDDYYDIFYSPYALDLPGYSYSDGYLFSGKLYADYGYTDTDDNFHSYGSNYYFALSSSNHSTRKDYFVTGKTLQSHSAVKLPAFDNSKWIAMGADKTVTFGESPNQYTFNTCNYIESGNPHIYPEYIGKEREFSDAQSATGNKLLSVNYLAENCSHTPLSIHGICGMVVYQGANFIFLPTAGTIDYVIPTYSSFQKKYWGGDIGGRRSKYLDIGIDKFEANSTDKLTRSMCVRSSWLN